MIKDLGYSDSQVKTKESIEELVVGRGSKLEKYKPDYALVVHGQPRCIIDAKNTEEDIDKWIEQCSGYCLALNRKFEAINPVQYFVLSNGKITKLYEWDKEKPLIILNFSDFVWNNPNYDRLKEILGEKSIIGELSTEVDNKSVDFLFERPTSEYARQLFTKCHRVIWKSEIQNPQSAFMEFVKVVFVKLWADRNLRKGAETKKYFDTSNKKVHLPQTSVVFSEEWIISREKEGVVNPIDSILFKRLAEDIELEIQLRKKKRIFEKDEHIKLKPDTIKEIVRRIQHYDLFGIDEDLNGRLFETFLNATMRGRDLGQFFTPRSIVKMMTQIARLKASREEQPMIIDMCCGSGGFLIEALTILRNQIRENKSISAKERDDLLETISNERLYGIDFGKEPPMARIARINMYLHGDGGSRIYYADALDKELLPTKDEDPELLQNRQELANIIMDTSFDVVLTNPPFSMTKEAKNKTECRILSKYDLAKKNKESSLLRPSLRSSAMFIERYYDVLKPGGTLITVIDDTLLASDVFRYVRKFIRDNFLIRAIISLPGDAFRRSGSRVKTSVLILEKKRDGTENQPTCFGFFSLHLGVDDLTPRASDTDIEEAHKLAETEIKRIVSGYKEYLAGKDTAIILPAENLKDRLDLKYCALEYGRLVEKWQSQGIQVKKLLDVVTPIEDLIIPSNYPTEIFTLIKVSYEGRCEVDKIKSGLRIKAKKMYRVKPGQLVFSTIRATDGAIGVVPQEFNGALVSGSYTVFECGTPEDTAYLWLILRSHELRADMQSQSPGSGRYTTYWPEIGELVLPWMDEQTRKNIGSRLIKLWEMEEQIVTTKQKIVSDIDVLGVESDESKERFRASKAPT